MRQVELRLGGAYSFQTMHGHGLFKRVWCCVVLRGKAAQWRVDAPEMCNRETPQMYRKANGMLNRAIGAFERQAGQAPLVLLRETRVVRFGIGGHLAGVGSPGTQTYAKNPPWH